MKLVGERTITEEQVAQVVEKINAKQCSKGAGIREQGAGNRDQTREDSCAFEDCHTVSKSE